MAKLAKATFTLIDSENKTTTRTYTHRTSDAIPEADVTGLATDLQALTGLSVIEAQITYPQDVSGISADVEDKASRQVDWSLEVRKSTLRNSRGGKYTFNLPDPKDVLQLGNGQVDQNAAVMNNFLENFDDGDGLAAVAGEWYISDGEEVVEATASANAVLAAYLNKD